MQAASSVGTPFSLMTPIGMSSIPNRVSSLEHVLTFPAHVPGFTHSQLRTLYAIWHGVGIALLTGI